MWLRLLVDFSGDPAGTITSAADCVAQVLIAGGVAEECSPPRRKSPKLMAMLQETKGDNLTDEQWQALLAERLIE